MVNSPEYYQTKLTTEYTNFNLVLNELQRTYPLQQLNPSKSVTEYILDNSKYQSSQAKLFSIKNKLEVDSQYLQVKNDDIIQQIDDLDISITKNTAILANLVNGDNGASGALSDINYRYNEKLIYNFLLGIIISSAVFVYYKKTSIMNMNATALITK